MQDMKKLKISNGDCAGRIPISNNLCESTIRPFATARRAWLFANTPDGVFANGLLYTLVESARQIIWMLMNT